MLLNYLKIAIRTILKNKVYSFINIVGLSLGITCCMVIMIFVKYELSFDSFHPEADNIFRVVQHTKFPEQTQYWNTTAYPLAEALRNDFTEFKKVTQVSGPATYSFGVENENGSVNRFDDHYVLFADRFYPEVFNIKWMAGNPKTALLNTHSIVLTENLVKKCFGDMVSDYSALLGKIILLNGKDPLTVTGVIENAPGNINLRYSMLIPYEFYRINNEYYSSNWSGNYQGTTFVVLKNIDSEKEIEAKIATWKKKYMKPEDDVRISYFLQPLSEIHTETKYGSSPGGYTMNSKIVSASLAIALFILIIACVNFINLTTALAAIRSKEVGIRKVLGGTRLRLIKQFMSENAILIIVALCVSIGLTQVLLDYLNRFMVTINLKLSFQWADAGLILLIGITVVAIAAIYPAVTLSSFKPIEALKNKFSVTQSHGLSLRKSLIVFQFAIVQLFIIATIIVATQMDYFKSKELGFVSEAVVIVPAPAADHLEVFRNKLLLQPGIDDVSFGSGPPISIDDFSMGSTFRLPHQAVEEGQTTEIKIADTRYADFYGLSIIAGRNFTTNKIPFDEFIVNEKVVKALGWKPNEAIGKEIVINEGAGTIVGVMKNFHNNSLQQDLTPCILMNWGYLELVSIKLNKASQTDVLANIENTWKEISPTSVYSYTFVTDAIQRNYATENLIFSGFTVFSILAITIGCLGLIGLMSFMTIRKTKEVGIRKVLGASVTEIVSLFSKEFLLLVLLAFVIASPFSYIAMEAWLQGFVYHVDLSWWMFATGGIIASAIAALTVSYQSVKAARANPVDSLRNE